MKTTVSDRIFRHGASSGRVLRLLRTARTAPSFRRTLPPAAALLIAGAWAGAAPPLPPEARISAGLVVHVGCGNGATTGTLRFTPRVLVHALDADAAQVRAARRRISADGKYGPITVDLWTCAPRLPYPDRLVDMLVCDRPEMVRRLSRQEIRRVLVPGGRAWLLRDGKWSSITGDRPPTIDDWTHYMHDPSGNAVAHDTEVAPPRRLQWLQPPIHTRSHEHTPSIQAVVSSDGRLFYIQDEGPVENVAAPARWRLVAREAFNGLLLWEKPIDVWFPHLINWGQLPVFLQRRLVAVDGSVFVTLGFLAPVSRLDAADGRVRQVYEGTEGTQEIIVSNGALLVTRVPPTTERTEMLRKVLELERRPDSPLFRRESAEPIVKKFIREEFRQGQRTVAAYDLKSGKRLWQKQGRDTSRLRYLSLRCLGNRVFFQNGGEIICSDLRTGRVLWRKRAPGLRTASGDRLVCADKKNVLLLSAEDGAVLWKQPLLIPFIRDVFIIRDTVCIGGFKPYDTGRRYTGPAWGPYFLTIRELRTGKVIRHITPPNPGHHHRCWLNKATDRYVIAGRRGAEFFDLSTGKVFWNDWVRGVCRYGTLPCNGLLYAPPHACGCYISAKIDGFYALRGGPHRPRTPEPVLEKGEVAPGNPIPAPSSAPAADWPTYRHDAARSGVSPVRISPDLRLLWTRRAGMRLTPPTVAGGKVFIPDREHCVVRALDSDTGRQVWQYTAGAQVDSPPTVVGGRVLFGVRNGTVVCLRAADGKTLWRLRLHPATERFVPVLGRVESAWPVFGSVLPHPNGSICFTDGRSSYLDGGIVLWRVDPRTGRVLAHHTLYSPDPETGQQPPASGPSTMPGFKADILSADADDVFLEDGVFSPDCTPRKGRRIHLFTLTGFLDDSWPHRSYWCFAERPSIRIGCGWRKKTLIYGRLLAFTDTTVYGYGRADVHWSNHLRDGACRVFAVQRRPQKTLWQKRVPIKVRALAVAGNLILAAGPELDPSRRIGADFATGKTARLLLLDAASGDVRASLPLPAPPVFDGLAVARGRVYVAGEDGTISCLGKN